jgi:hypothetical protein
MIYVILAHHAPQMLGVLIKSLYAPQNHFIVHIDAQQDIRPFVEAVTDVENCHFLKDRYESKWGSFGLVDATLEALRYIRETLRKRQRIILLSGSDFPVKNKQYITDFLASNKDAIYIEHDPIPNKTWSNGGIPRFPLYHEVSKDIRFYGGSQWFSIPHKVVTIIFNFLKLNPDFLAYFRHVYIADESFFQTLLLNCEHPYVKMNIQNRNLHFIKWDYPFIHPRVLMIDDLEPILQSNSLFARKFDKNSSASLIEAIKKVVCL